MSDNLARQFEILPLNLSNHLKICVVAIVMGLLLSLPLAALLVRRATLRAVALGVAGVIQTIPGLALLALMVAAFAEVGEVGRGLFGVEIPVLGFYPTVVALALYSVLPILRNTITGLMGVEPSLVEAARGVGMTDRQVLFRVQLPLAMPVIVAGIRTATVWVVGTATLATPVGQRSLGNYIFSGLQTRNWVSVIFGCVCSAFLAILLDVLIGTIERAIAQRRRALGIVAATLLLLIFAGGLVAPNLVARLQGRSGVDAVAIGSKTFTEQYILASLFRDALEARGIPARRVEDLGSTLGFDALVRSEIDLYVDYSGTIWANYMKRSGLIDREELLVEVNDWLLREYEVRSLGSLGFENAYALAMRRDRAEELGIETIRDLRSHAGAMGIGGDYEFFDRPEWDAIRTSYGVDFGREVSYDSTFMYEAVSRGEVDVISAFTTDARIETYDLKLLDDPIGAIPPYDALLLLSPEASRRPGVIEAVAPFIGAISEGQMRRANGLVDRDSDKRSPEEAAELLRSWLIEDAPKPEPD